MKLTWMGLTLLSTHFLASCVIKVEVPTSKTKLEKQISGDVVPTEEAILMRAVTRGQGEQGISSEVSNKELQEREAAWIETATRYLDAGYIGWKPEEGLEKVPSREDESSEYYEGLLISGRINQIYSELKKRGLQSKLGPDFRDQIKKGWFYFENGRWIQFGVGP